ncbi:MAG: ChbG/HpnK family deacetylase [Anaerolineae bacterium]|nr:ChbG/HpnK family deacetylase [Anaerolineae bacterium]
MKYLIINADDFGLSPQINRGICDAFQRGVVTDTSALVCSPYAPAALEMGQKIGLPMGVHIDFVSPFVSEKSACLGAHGRLVRELFQREYQKKIGSLFSARELLLFRDEIRRQVEMFTNLTGCLPSHLDYHFGLHYLPDVMAIYLLVAEEYRLPVRWGRQYAGENPTVIAPDHFCDRFRGHKEGNLSLLIELLGQPWNGVMEMCCHPGYFTPFDLPEESYNIEREYELKTLTDPRLKDEIARLGIELVNFHWMSAHYRNLTVETGMPASNNETLSDIKE